MKKVLVLLHKDLVPPDKASLKEREEAIWKTEYDVVSTLKKNKYDVLVLGVESDLSKIRFAIDTYQPHIVFNLLEEFDGEAVFDQNIVSYLQLKNIPFTGNGPRGLILSRDKALCKKILKYHRIPVPDFHVFRKGKSIHAPSRLRFPLIVKSLTEESSTGISQASIVSTLEKMKERIDFIFQSIGTHAIVEEYIEGREIYVGVLGNQRLQILPPWEMFFQKAPDGMERIATSQVKHNPAYRKKHGIITKEFKKDAQKLLPKIQKVVRRTYKNLYLCGYARIDLRIDSKGTPFVIEANPNPDIASMEDFAQSANKIGLTYDQLLNKIVRLGLSRDF